MASPTDLSPFAQGVVNDVLSSTFPARPATVDPLQEVLKGMPSAANPNVTASEEEDLAPAFSKRFFGVDSPDQILKPIEPLKSDPSKMIYEFAGDGKRYNIDANKSPEEVLEAIWDHNSPGVWGATKGEALYNLPAAASSILAHSLSGVGLEDLGEEWHQYADSLKEEYNKNYGQFMVPDVTAAWDEGKLYDYALQTMGAAAPYLAVGGVGGAAGRYAAGQGAARLGTFLGATGITAPITIAQFADRQVEQMKLAGVENPRDNIDWVKAGVLGTAAAGFQSLPIDSILYAGPVLKTLEKWGVGLGSSMSRKVLGNLADVTGTNAFASLGASGLSRLNADMPMLDDNAKLEYLDSVVRGTLVGVPFGVYKGYKYQAPPKKAPPSGPTAPERRESTPVSEAAKGMEADTGPIIYGTDESGPEPLALPKPENLIFRNPTDTMGINNRVEAADYLANIKYKDPNGNDTDGLTAFDNHWRQMMGKESPKAWTDQDLIDAARKAKFVRSREDALKRTKNGVLYQDQDALPQKHSSTEEILTKAAALADQFGYNDLVVKGFSDDIIRKLYKMNVQRDLEKNGAKYPEQIRKQVFDQFENFVDKNVIEEVNQYGSLYRRPVAEERIRNNIKNANQMLSQNPRKKLAEALMKRRRDEAEKKQYAAQEGVPVEDVAHVFDGERPIHIYHGTSKKNADSIKKSGKFDPEAGERHYAYSDFGDFSSYFTKDPNSFWLDRETAGDRRAAEYETVLKSYLKSSARIFKISTFEDAQKLAKMLGYTDEVTKPFTLYEEIIKKGTPGEADFFVDSKGRVDDRLVGPVSKPRLKDAVHKMMDDVNWNAHGTKAEQARMSTLKDKLKRLGIDAIDVAEGFYDSKQFNKQRAPYTNNLTDGQFIVFNHDIVSPSLYKKIRTRPGDPPIRAFDDTKPPRFIEEPPVDGEPFGPYAGMRRDPNIRGLLEYKPKEIATVLTKAANMPGTKATPKLTKAQVVDGIMKTPLIQDLLKTGTKSTEELREIARKYVYSRKKSVNEPKLEEMSDSSFKPVKNQPKGKTAKQLWSEADPDSVAGQALDALRSELYKIAQERNADILKANPDLGPALNQMFKTFAEMSANVKIPEKPRIVKATKKLQDAVIQRVKMLQIIETAFQKVHPNLAKVFKDNFNMLLAGKELPKATFNQLMTSLHTAFNIDKPGKLNEEGLVNWYKDMRSFLPEKTIEALNKNRKFIEDWYKTVDGMSEKDTRNFSTDDMEALAFAKYLKNEFAANVKDFKELRQYKIFNAFENSFKKMKKEFADLKFNKLEDILEYNDSQETFEVNSKAVPPEARQGGVMFDRIVEEANRNNDPDDIGIKAKAEQVKETAAMDNGGTPPPRFTNPPKTGGGGRDGKDPFLSAEKNQLGEMIGKLSFIFSIPKLARQYPLMGKAHNIFVKQKDIAAQVDDEFTTRFRNIFENIANKDWDKVHKAHDILDHFRNTKQDLVMDSLDRVILKDENGNEIVLDDDASQMLKYLNDYYKVGPREDLKVTRSLLNNYKKEYNLDENSSLEQLKDVITNLSDRIDGNPLPEFRNKYLRDKGVLEAFHSEISAINNILDPKKAYVPHMRLGNYVIWVKDKKTGDLKHMEVIDNTDNVFGFKMKSLPDDKFVQSKIDKMGLRNKYNPKDYEITHGQLTHNDAAKFIQRGMLSMELIQSLLATGLEGNIKLANKLATGVDDPVQFLKDLSNEAGSTKSHIMKYILAQGRGKYMLPENEPLVDGYNKNWDKVMDAYKNSWKNSIARKAVSLDMSQYQKDVLRSTGIDPRLKDIANNYIDYMNDPSSDFGYLRGFNFFWTMGYRPSSALLQLVTLPTQSMANLIGYTKNPLSSLKYMSQAMKDYASFVERRSPEGRKAHFYRTRENEDFQFFNDHPAYFRHSMVEDAIAREIETDFTEHMGKTAQTVEAGVRGIVNNAGIFISAAENFTRKTTFMAYRRMFDESPEITRKALKDLEKEYDWQYFWENNKDKMRVEQALAMYNMRLVHAEFGKIGRGELQRGLPGSVFFPFMTYPQQMLELLFDQISGRKGQAGVIAGLYTTAAYVSLAGVAGIPAYELWKTLYEEYEKKVNGRAVDLNMQMTEAGIPQWLRKGTLSTLTGVDVADRMAQDVIAQSLLIGLMKDELKFGDIGGVPGRALTDAMGALTDPNRSWWDKAQSVVPSTAKDAMKAVQTVVDPESAYKTKSGKILKDPDEITAFDTSAKALGFTTLEQTEAREKLFYQQRANQEFNLWKSRLAESVATAEFYMHQGTINDDPEKYKYGRELRNQMTKELREFAKANDIKLDSKFWRGFRTSVQERLWQKKHPGKIKKPTAQERRYPITLGEKE